MKSQSRVVEIRMHLITSDLESAVMVMELRTASQARAAQVELGQCAGAVRLITAWRNRRNSTYYQSSAESGELGVYRCDNCTHIYPPVVL